MKPEVEADPKAQYSSIEIIETPEGGFYLEMNKRENATYTFNDGLIFHFDKYYEHFYNKLREMENQTSTADLASGLINHDPPIKRPQHIRFSVSTPSGDKSQDVCNVRLTSMTKVQDPDGSILYKEDPESTIFLFRLGSYRFAKLNLLYILMKYEPHEWINVDILINWTNFDDFR